MKSKSASLVAWRFLWLFQCKVWNALWCIYASNVTIAKPCPVLWILKSRISIIYLKDVQCTILCNMKKIETWRDQFRFNRAKTSKNIPKCRMLTTEWLQLI
eukprot:scaffold2687_cov120-Skeletonema_dohrnii-CCMP3373.AAC.5